MLQSSTNKSRIQHFATNYQARGSTHESNFGTYLPSKYLGMCVYRYIDNYRLYPPGTDLPPAFICFLHFPNSNEEIKDTPICLNHHIVTLSNIVFTQTWENCHRRHTPPQASLGCNIINSIFCMFLKSIWIYPALTSAHNIAFQ